MGMFDYFQCDMPLPEGTPALQWQTKSVNCCMDHLAIRADGRLVDTNKRMEQKPGAPPAPEQRNLEYNPAYHKWYNEWWEPKEGPDEPINYTGEVKFYGMDVDKVWWEFCAFIRHGICFEIVQIVPEADPLKQGRET